MRTFQLQYEPSITIRIIAKKISKETFKINIFLSESHFLNNVEVYVKICFVLSLVY